MGRAFTSFVVFSPPPPSYLGPGYVVSGATAWGGLRAYTSSTIGNNAVRLRRSSDNAELDFVTLDDGALEIDNITTWAGGSDLFVVKIYDQTGNGYDMPQTSGNQQAKFILGGLGSQPVMRFDSASPIQSYESAASVSSSLQPYTVSFVAMRSAVNGVGQIVFSLGSAVPNCGFAAAANQADMWGGGSHGTATAADGSFHAVQCAYDGAASNLNVDGTDNTVSPGTSNAAGTVGIGGGAISGFELETGDIVEGGIWLSKKFSSAECASMSSNQRAFWGF